jgi:hypothetical protein
LAAVRRSRQENSGVRRYLRFVFSHSWFATVQDVLQADWQEAWHSPQPLPAVALRLGLAIVFICFMTIVSPFMVLARRAFCF